MHITPLMPSSPILPYLEAGPVQLLGQPVQAFGLLVWLALAVGTFCFQRRVLGLARRGADWRGEIDPRLANRALLAGLLAAFALSHALYLLAYLPAGSRVTTGLALDLASGMSSLGGLFGLLAGTALWARLARRPVLPWLDAITWGAAHGWVVARLGCSFAHDHLGPFTDSWFAVRWPPALDRRLNPGGLAGRHDLGLDEMLVTLGIVVCLRAGDRWWRSRHERRAAAFPALAIVSFLYAPSRFALELLRTGEPAWLGLTPAQYACIGLLGVGALAAGAGRARRRAVPAVEPASGRDEARRAAAPEDPAAARSPRTWRRVAALGAVAFLPAAASGAQAQVPSFSADWQGDWEIVLSFTDAGSSEPHLVETVTESICAGDTFGLEPFVPPVACSEHSIDATGVHLVCDAAASVAGCSGQGTMTFDLTRMGDLLSGGGDVAYGIGGGCAPSSVDLQVTVVGTRLTPAASACAPPTETSFVAKFVFLPELRLLALVGEQVAVPVPVAGVVALVALAVLLVASGWRLLR